MKDTKTKLLKTAAALFARRGVDGVSTRELAKQAGVNLCAINYYFGSKQKLYEAVVDEVIATINGQLFNSKALPEEKVSPQEEIKTIICRFFDFLCGNAISDVQAMLMVNEIFSPSTAYDNFYPKIIEPIHRRISYLTAKILRMDENEPEAMIITHTLFGQAIIFRIHKEALLRRMNIKKYTPEVLDNIKKQIAQNCDAVLESARRLQ